jgi:hypothetical protein
LHEEPLPELGDLAVRSGFGGVVGARRDTKACSSIHLWLQGLLRVERRCEQHKDSGGKDEAMKANPMHAGYGKSMPVNWFL